MQLTTTRGLVSTPVRTIGVTLAAALLLTLSAKVQVPFWPVPMTLQTMAVLGLAAALGPRLGLAAMLTYLAAGAAGLPVFAGTPERGIGLAYMAGPTGGYLAGFAVAMIATGWLAQGRGLIVRALAMLVGLAAIHGLGLAWLSNFVPSDKLLAAGFMPFILGDLVKLVLAALLIEGGRRIARRA